MPSHTAAEKAKNKNKKKKAKSKKKVKILSASERRMAALKKVAGSSLGAVKLKKKKDKKKGK